MSDGERRAAAPAAATLLRALAHPLRIAIIEELAQRSMCVHELVDATGASQVIVSQHLRVLRSAGTVRGTRRGKEIEYALIDPHVGHIVGDAVSHAMEGLAGNPAQPADQSGIRETPAGEAPA